MLSEDQPDLIPHKRSETTKFQMVVPLPHRHEAVTTHSNQWTYVTRFVSAKRNKERKQKQKEERKSAKSKTRKRVT